MFFRFFKKKKSKAVNVSVALNAKLQPLDRGSIFEDVFAQLNKKKKRCEVVGGGSLLETDKKEIHSCDIDFEVFQPFEENFAIVKQVLNLIGVPKGSSYTIGDDQSTKTQFGELQGLALYLQASILEAEENRGNDINALIEQLHTLLDKRENYFSYWQDGEKTALYFYGKSYCEMEQAILPAIEQHPLCKNYRLVQIA